MQGCAATFTILGKARRGRMKIQTPGLRQHIRSNVQSNVQDYFRCSLLRRVSPKPQFNGISYSLVFPIKFIYLILITFYSYTEQPLKCKDIKCCFRICCIKVHLLCIPEFPDLVATMQSDRGDSKLHRDPRGHLYPQRT